MRIKRAIAAAAMVVGISTVGLASGEASAAVECTVANFSVGGVFDQEGYLACLAAAGSDGGAGGAGGRLPATGNDQLQTIGLAAGIVLVGGAMFMSAQRRKTIDDLSSTADSS